MEQVYGVKKHIPVLTLYIIGLVDFFLGVQKYAPNATVTRDLGIPPNFDKQWKSIIRLWFRLNNMSSNRLNAKVHKWADSVSIKHKCVKNWIFLEKKPSS